MPSAYYSSHITIAFVETPTIQPRQNPQPLTSLPSHSSLYVTLKKCAGETSSQQCKLLTLEVVMSIYR